MNPLIFHQSHTHTNWEFQDLQINTGLVHVQLLGSVSEADFPLVNQQFAKLNPSKFCARSLLLNVSKLFSCCKQLCGSLKRWEIMFNCFFNVMNDSDSLSKEIPSQISYRLLGKVWRLIMLNMLNMLMISQCNDFCLKGEFTILNVRLNFVVNQNV